MKLTRTWILSFLLTVASFVCWFQFSYPQLEFVNFSIDRTKALQSAQDYLRQRSEDPSRFKTAIIFESDGAANRYLQQTLGFDRFIHFIRENDFDLFYWVARFFQENEKEEYRVFVSSATGEIIAFQHIIDENEARPAVEQEKAKRQVQEFLTARFQFDPDRYLIRDDVVNTLDNRSDFSFSWQKKDVSIPWSKEENSGTGKLLMSATISGNEILSFSKNSFSVSDQFNRHLERMGNTGRILSTAVRLFYLVLFTAVVFFIIVRRNNLAMHTTKRFYMGLMAVSFFLSLCLNINQFQDVIFQYHTTASFRIYFWQFTVQTTINALFISITIFMPSLAGETLHYQFFREKTTGSFLHYVRSSFLSRQVTTAVALGYFVFVVMLGIQAVIIKIGQEYWGVWIDHTWMNNLSTAYLPFVTALIIGLTASLAEELTYRLFTISWGKMIFKNTLIAVIFSSLIWGFSHSNYPVFPMWFRGVEVTCLGLFLSAVYLRWGIIPVIVGHYLFDVFWNCSEHLFGVSQPFYVYGALGVLSLPMIWACAAFIVNRKAEIKPMHWRLTKHQHYNLEVLKTFLKVHKQEFDSKTPQQIKEEISSHGWDMAVVEIAMEDLGIVPRNE